MLLDFLVLNKLRTTFDDHSTIMSIDQNAPIPAKWQNSAADLAQFRLLMVKPVFWLSHYGQSEA